MGIVWVEGGGRGRGIVWVEERGGGGGDRITGNHCTAGHGVLAEGDKVTSVHLQEPLHRYPEYIRYDIIS